LSGLGQAFAEGVQTYRLGLQVTQLDCQGIDVSLGIGVHLCQLLLLLGKGLAHAMNFMDRAAAGTHDHKRRSCSRAGNQQQDSSHDSDQPHTQGTVADIKGSWRLSVARNEYDLHGLHCLADIRSLSCSLPARVQPTVPNHSPPRWAIPNP
jgi:hypothetical protein